MPKFAKYNVVIIGCGNVAWHVAKQLANLKKYSVTVYNHKVNPNLKRFSTELNCTITVGLNDVSPEADFYFICVADKFVSAISKKITIVKKNAIIMHTAGSLPLNAIKTKWSNVGVFYPLQTFSKNDKVNWKQVPLVLEGINADTKRRMKTLADSFSNEVLFLNYEERLRVHLCAVMVNNFTNALFTAASDLLEKYHSGSFKLLMPLIRQTVCKLESMSPREAQTGPAKRNDRNVIKKHLELLSGEKLVEEIYKQLTKLILSQQKAYA